MDSVPSKNKIILGWFLLIVLSICLIGLIYIKHTYKNTLTKEIKPGNIETEEVITELNEIVTNFNNNSLLNKYESDDKLRLKASLNKNIITINYVSITEENLETTGEEENNINSFVTYVYDETTNILTSIKSDNIDEDIYNKIFRVLVLSTQQRLEIDTLENTSIVISDTETTEDTTTNSNVLEEDIEKIIDKFLSGEDVEGLTRKENGYSINITVKFKKPEENKEEENTNIEADIIDAVRRVMPNTNENTEDSNTSVNDNNDATPNEQPENELNTSETQINGNE